MYIFCIIQFKQKCSWDRLSAASLALGAMQVSTKCKGTVRRLEYVTNSTYFPTAVFQQDVDVLLVFKMVIEVHNVLVVQCSVQFNLSVNLAEKRSNMVTIVTKRQICDNLRFNRSSARAQATAQARGAVRACLPSRVGEAWRRVHAG